MRDIVFQVFLIAFGAVVLLLLAIAWVLDMAARIEYAQGVFPPLKKWTENRKWQRVLLICTMLFYGGTLYELLKEPPLAPLKITDPTLNAVTPIVRENADLQKRLAVLTQPESRNSLRLRTMRIVKELNEFWSRRVTPTQIPVQNPGTDEERQRAAAWDRYWRDAKAAYLIANYRERLVGIVREYKNKGVDTGTMEQAFDQPERLVGAAPYGGWQLDNCAQYMNELCQLRELAYHVDAQDQRIDLPY